MFQYQAFLSTILWILFWIFCWNILFGTQTVLFFVVWISFGALLLLFLLKKHHIVFLLWIVWIFFWVAYSQYFLFQTEQNFAYLSKSFEQKSVTFTGEVRELYKKSPDFNTYILDIEHSINNKNVNIGILFTVSPQLSFDYKENIEISGKLDKIDNFSSSFDMKRFMLVKNVYGKFWFSNVEKLWSEKKDTFLWKIFSIRNTLLESIYAQYPQKEALLLAWILLWARENIPKDMQSDFNNSWLTHLMAVSGFNITILIFFTLYLVKFFPVFLRVIFVTIVISFFTLLVWEAVPVLRASIMGLLSYYILMMGRQSDALALLLFTALVLVLFNPLSLNYDISLHLSFLAVLGLLYFQDFWRKMCWFLPQFFAIRESFVLTLAAMTPTLPVMIFTFWQVSVLAPVANMLVGGMIPFTMFFGFLTLILSFFTQVWAYFVWYITYFCLKLINEIAHFFWQLEMSVWKYEAWQEAVYLEITYFLLLIFFILYLQNKKTPA